MPYREPLKAALYDDKFFITSNKWINKITLTTTNHNTVEYDFVWPDVVAACTNSVQSTFNPSPLPPRVYSTTDAALLARIELFRNDTDPYYENLNTLSKEALVKKMKRKSTYKGDTISTTGV